MVCRQLISDLVTFLNNKINHFLKRRGFHQIYLFWIVSPDQHRNIPVSLGEFKEIESTQKTYLIRKYFSLVHYHIIVVIKLKLFQNFYIEILQKRVGTPNCIKIIPTGINRHNRTPNIITNIINCILIPTIHCIIRSRFHHRTTITIQIRWQKTINVSYKLSQIVVVRISYLFRIAIGFIKVQTTSDHQKRSTHYRDIFFYFHRTFFLKIYIQSQRNTHRIKIT